MTLLTEALSDSSAFKIHSVSFHPYFMAGKKMDTTETVIDLTLETPKRTRTKTSLPGIDGNIGKGSPAASTPVYFTPDRPTKALNSPVAPINKDKSKTEETGSPETSNLVSAMQSLDLQREGSMREGWGPSQKDTPEIGTSVRAHRPSPVGLDWHGAGQSHRDRSRTPNHSRFRRTRRTNWD